MIRYIRNSLLELKKVNWPTTKQALAYTIIVILITAAVAAILGLSDFGFTRLLKEVI